MGTNWIDEPVALLSVDEMYRADAAAAAAGVKTGFTMSRGRGFVAARLLAEAGREVRLALLGGRDGLKGDAATNAGRWDGAVAPLSPDAIAGAGIVVDAIFGAGLARPLDGIVAATVEAVNAGTAPCLAVDVPSGVDGDTGAVRGAAIRADETVTFFRRKPAHLLYPGRGLCGVVRVADIGIPATVLGDISPSTAGNCPALWLDSFPWPDAEGHKYARGHVGVAGGETMTGAARLASHAALRAGAGLVTIFSPPPARSTAAASRTSWCAMSPAPGRSPRCSTTGASRRWCSDRVSVPARRPGNRCWPGLRRARTACSTPMR